MAGLPYITWYPGDWLKDPCVQSLDYECQGIWFKLLCHMHESDERGVLKMSTEQIAQLLGLSPSKTASKLSKLKQAGVASEQQNTGYLMNRRMVRETAHDQEIRQKRAEAGRQGGLAKASNARKQKVAPSSSSSSSSSTSKEKEKDKEKERTYIFANAKNENEKESRPPLSNEPNEDPEQEKDVRPPAALNGRARWQIQSEAFLAAYPKRIGTGSVRKWFEVNQPTEELMKTILKAIEQQKRSVDWKKGIIPAPTKWLEEGRWDDVLEPAEKIRRVAI
jgi:hypothetical protein